MAHLVLGIPGPVAHQLVTCLIADGQNVITVLPGPAQGLDPRVRVFHGDAAHIDLGLYREEFRQLCDLVSEITVAETVDQEGASLPVDPERSRSVRIAAEVVELVQATGRTIPVRFLSSLRIFGRGPGFSAETDLRIGQTFPDPTSEALAVAEKQVRSVKGPLFVVRIAPLVGSEDGTLFPDSDLAKVVRFASQAPDDVEMACSDALVHIETVERAAQILSLAKPEEPARTVHIVDDEPWSERRLMEWVFGRFEKRLLPPVSANAGLSQLLKGPSVRLRPVEMVYGRTEAAKLFEPLLSRDLSDVLGRLIPSDGAVDA